MTIATLAKAFCVAGIVAACGVNSAKADTALVNPTTVNPGALTVLSNGTAYTTLSHEGVVAVGAEVAFDAGDFGKVVSWWVQPRITTDIGMATEVGGMWFSRVSESYSYGNRPRSVSRQIAMGVSRAQFEATAVGMCNTIAAGLRFQGMSNAEIFATDRKASYTVELEAHAQFNGSGSNNVAWEAPEGPLTLNVICKAWIAPQSPNGGLKAPQLPGRPELHVQILPEPGENCGLTLELRLRDAVPGTPVQYRVRRSDGSRSPVYETVVNARGGFDLAQRHAVPNGPGPETGWMLIESPQDSFPPVRDTYAFDCSDDGRDSGRGGRDRDRPATHTPGTAPR